MSFDREVDLDRNGIFSAESFEQISTIRDKLEIKRDNLLKAIIKVDAVVVFLLLGQDWEIPEIGIKITDIPAILELAILYSSIVFIFSCAAFVNWLCYDSLSDQLGVRAGRASLVDPDFINMSRKEFNIVTKIFRKKMCIWHDDFFLPSKNFVIISRLIITTLLISFYTLPAMHIFVTVWGIIFSFDYNGQFTLTLERIERQLNH